MRWEGGKRWFGAKNSATWSCYKGPYTKCIAPLTALYPPEWQAIRVTGEAVEVRGRTRRWCGLKDEKLLNLLDLNITWPVNPWSTITIDRLLLSGPQNLFLDRDQVFCSKIMSDSEAPFSSLPSLVSLEQLGNRALTTTVLLALEELAATKQLRGFSYKVCIWRDQLEEKLSDEYVRQYDWNHTYVNFDPFLLVRRYCQLDLIDVLTQSEGLGGWCSNANRKGNHASFREGAKISLVGVRGCVYGGAILLSLPHAFFEGTMIEIEYCLHVLIFFQ